MSELWTLKIDLEKTIDDIYEFLTIKVQKKTFQFAKYQFILFA